MNSVARQDARQSRRERRRVQRSGKVASVSQQDAARPVYPTWIRSRRIVAFWLVAAGIVVLGVVVAYFWLPGVAIALLAIPFLYIAIVLTWTFYRLGPRGGDVQNKIHQLLIDSVGNEGR